MHYLVHFLSLIGLLFSIRRKSASSLPKKLTSNVV